MIYDVFVSYSRRDMLIADEICKRIQSIGLTCFTDRNNIPPGSDYVEYLRKAIRRCKIFLYIASNNSYNSQWSHYELKEFLDEQSIQDLIVYVIDDCELPKDLLEEIDEKCILVRKARAVENRHGCVTDMQLAVQLLKASKGIHMEDVEDDFGTITPNQAVFISHSHSDNAVADKIYNYLSQNGLRCWIDLHDIPAGVPYAQAIMEGLQSSDSLVVLYSKNVIESHDMLDELQEAHTTQRRIIPFLLDDTPMIGQFRYYLARRQWINAYPEYEEHLPELLYALMGKAPDKKEVVTTVSHQKIRESSNVRDEKKGMRCFKELVMDFLHLRKYDKFK